MDDLIKSLPGLLQTIDSPEVTEAAVIAAWKHATGEGLRPHAVPLRLDGRILRVAVADSVWQNQLRTMCAQLVYRVNALLGKSLVDRIELEIDSSALKPRRLPPTNIRPDEDEVPADLLNAAGHITDTHLRQSFLRAAMSATKRLEDGRDKK